MTSRSILRRSARRGRTSGTTTDGEWIADWLVRYINTPAPDPYDFGWLLRTWADEEDIHSINDDTTVDDLDDDAREAYAKWLRSADGEGHIYSAMGSAPELVPAYMVMHRARRLPRGSWLIHFTDRDPFLSFDRGATLETPLWYTGGHNPSAKKAKCPENLSEDIGPYEVVFGFAFDMESSFPTIYGRNAVLFRSDLAVSFYHDNDQETQVTFPICAEYDAIAIYGTNRYGGGTVTTRQGNEQFSTVEDIIAAFDRGTFRSSGRAAGSTMKTRWHPRVASPKRMK